MSTQRKVLLTLFVSVIVTAILISLPFHSQTSQLDPHKQLQQLAEQAMANQKYTPLTPAQQRKVEADQKKAAAELDKENEPLRVAFAKFTEDALLRDGYNVDVTAYGPKHKFLELKWVLASKSMVFNFTEQRQDMLTTMKQEGFTKFTITDGYDENWTWDLTK